MHIVFLTSEFPTVNQNAGGVGSFVFQLANSLVSKGVRVSVVGLYLNDIGYKNESGIHIYRLPHSKGRLKFLGNAKAINRTLQSIQLIEPIDVIEGSELTLAFIKRNKGTKYIIRMHGGHNYFARAENRPIVFWKHLQETISFKKADKLVAVSNYVAKRTKELLNLKSEVTVIYNPVDVQKFYFADSEKAKADRIIFVGSLVEKKGIRQLIQAMPKIAAEIPTVELVIVGREGTIAGSREPYLPFLKTFIAESISSKIEFFGPVPYERIPALLETAELCVYPSHMEAMPMAWLEALSMGKAFVGSNTGPGNEAVIPGVTGMLANPHDPDDIAEKVIWMLKHKDEARRMGIAARKDVLERFSLEQKVIENISFFQSCLQS